MSEKQKCKLCCNNTRAKRVSIEIYGQVWRDQPRGKPKGAKPPRVFPEVDPDTRGQVNSMLRVRASVLSLLIAGMTVTNTQKVCRQSWKS